ncbi:hypothetical protein AB4212_15740, partial [Streptomyces sp. 2MCAF27]
MSPLGHNLPPHCPFPGRAESAPVSGSRPGAWLSALTAWELGDDDEEEYQTATDPPVPAGLTTPQRALADYLRVDADLLAIAAQSSP